MASKTSETRKKRINKIKKLGRKRKNKLNNHGTTISNKNLFKLVKEHSLLNKTKD
jgi:hypothetical protein